MISPPFSTEYNSTCITTSLLELKSGYVLFSPYFVSTHSSYGVGIPKTAGHGRYVRKNKDSLKKKKL